MSNTATVYALINGVTGKMYVGRTQRPLRWRIKEHIALLKRGRHTNKRLQADFNKYGDCFVTVQLEIESGKESREQYWMKRLKTYDEKYGYNDLDAAAKTLRKEAGLYVKPSPLKGRKRNLQYS